MLFACLAAAFGLFYLQTASPRPEPASASLHAFSAGRAMADVAAIAPIPHPTGSAANARVRDYLIARMTALGLSPQVQRAESHVVESRKTSTLVLGATVENVIGVLPGRDHSLPALALMAHYDSVPGSPGAADDAAGVAAALEILRGIKAGGTPARDVMLVITDGEEAGLLGARAFYGEHPLAGHVGFVINFEARGGGGRAHMFQTGPDNAGAVRLFAADARRPQSNSLTVQVYKMMPNDTDFTVTDARRLPGLNLAFLGRQFDYHSPSSTVAALDQGALQSLGEQAFGPAVDLAFHPTPPRPGLDLVYGNLPGGVILAYPTWGGWVVLALAAGLTALGATRARQGKALAWRDLWRGLGAGVLLLLGGMTVLALTRRLTGVDSGWMEYRPLLARFPLFEAAMGLSLVGAAMLVPAATARGRLRLFGSIFFLAAGALAAVLNHFASWPITVGMAAASALLAFLVFGKGASVCGTWTGLLLTGLGVTLALQIALPTAALVTAWPLLAGAALNALMAGGRDRRAWIVAAAWIMATASLSWIGFFAHTLMQGLDQPEAPALAIWTGAMVAWPLLWPAQPEGRLGFAAPALVILAGLATALFIRVTDPWSPRHPRAEEVLYAVDPGGRKAWRVSTEPLDGWSRAVLTADGGAISPQALPGFRAPVLSAPASLVAAPSPSITLQKAADGRVTLNFTPAAGTTDLELRLKTSVPMGDATLNGRAAAILGKPGATTLLVWRGGDPLSISFRPASASGGLSLSYADYLAGWPAGAKPLPAMPRDAMGFDLSGSTLVVADRALAW
ncbi:MAG: M20/M25/M40 family metallo-hydrolase [Proteobacteria bacterium]|nr:M20/M25/M40 family metallo-hydrolase [Pseudomonadota bacterium]